MILERIAENYRYKYIEAGATLTLDNITHNGAFIVLDNDSDVSITLSNTIPINFRCFIVNKGLGGIILNPSAVTIRGEESTSLENDLIGITKIQADVWQSDIRPTGGAWDVVNSEVESGVWIDDLTKVYKQSFKNPAEGILVSGVDKVVSVGGTWSDGQFIRALPDYENGVVVTKVGSNLELEIDPATKVARTIIVIHYTKTVV